MFAGTITFVSTEASAIGQETTSVCSAAADALDERVEGWPARRSRVRANLREANASEYDRLPHRVERRGLRDEHPFGVPIALPSETRVAVAGASSATVFASASRVHGPGLATFQIPFCSGAT